MLSLLLALTDRAPTHVPTQETLEAVRHERDELRQSLKEVPARLRQQEEQQAVAVAASALSAATAVAEEERAATEALEKVRAGTRKQGRMKEGRGLIGIEGGCVCMGENFASSYVGTACRSPDSPLVPLVIVMSATNVLRCDVHHPCAVPSRPATGALPCRRSRS